MNVELNPRHQVRRIEFSVPIVVGGYRISPSHLIQKLQRFPCLAVTPLGETPQNSWKNDQGQYSTEGIQNDNLVAASNLNNPNPQITQLFAEAQQGFFFPQSKIKELEDEEIAMFRSQYKKQKMQVKEFGYKELISALKACLPNTIEEDPSNPNTRQKWSTKITQLEGLEGFVSSHDAVKIIGSDSFLSGRTFLRLKSNRDEGLTYAGILIHHGLDNYPDHLHFYMDMFVHPDSMVELHKADGTMARIDINDFLTRHVTKVQSAAQRYAMQNSPCSREAVSVTYERATQTFDLHGDNFKHEGFVPTLEFIRRVNDTRDFLTCCLKVAVFDYRRDLGLDIERTYSEARQMKENK
jgi:hypothetical protein